MPVDRVDAMADSRKSLPSDFRTQQAIQIDAICDRFETHRGEGGARSLASFLDEMSEIGEEARRELFVSLLEVELELAARTGQVFAVDELCEEFVEWAGTVRQVVRDHERFAAECDPASLTPVLPVDRVFDELEQSGLASASFAVKCRAEWEQADGPRPGPATTADLATWLVEAGAVTEYQAEQLIRGRGASLVLGNYEIVRPLGQGGMGIVYLGRHRVMKRVVAIKVLHERALASGTGTERFRQEVVTIARLIHPRIVTAHDADTIDGRRFLVMEYVDGTDLSTWVQQEGPLALDDAIDCVLQAADGLAYAHEHGVVHRDIKPANLVRGQDGAVKLLDMGLAHSIGESTPRGQTPDTPTDEDPESRLTVADGMLGTPHFVAPEQATHARDADHRVDIYSLGATFYFLLSGQTMFDADSASVLVQMHQGADRPSLAEACHGVPSSIVEVFDRMTAVDPDDRFSSMGKLSKALSACRQKLSAEERGLHVVRPAQGGFDGRYDSTQFTQSFETRTARDLEETSREPIPGDTHAHAADVVRNNREIWISRLLLWAGVAAVSGILVVRWLV